jgi:beta-lactamase regulating signal transducer with metallopeptidase domain
MPAYINFLNALGWSLLDSIWQMAVLWTVFYILTVGNIRISAAGKHNLILLFVFFGTEWFVYNFIQMPDQPAIFRGPGFIPVIPSVSRWIPYLSAVYLLIIITRLLHYGFQYYARKKNTSGQTISPVFQSFAERHTRLMGITRRVRVYLSDTAETAETSGFIKPLILLPVSLLTNLRPQQVEAILVHELFHIRRHDYLINIFMSVFRSIFFFNPFAHLFYKALARERELACDDGVLEKGFEPALYAEALFSLEKFRQIRPGFSIAADGNKPWLLMERIRRVLGKPALHRKRFNPLLLVSGILAFTLLILQQKATPSGGQDAVAANPGPAMPSAVEMLQVKMNEPSTQIRPQSPARPKTAKKKIGKPLQPVSPADLQDGADSKPLEMAFFAENNVGRDFSNQSAAGPTRVPIHVFPGTPFVPSVSLSYEDLPEFILKDSVLGKLEVLESELETNRVQLHELKIANHNSFRSTQRDIKPVLDSLQREIKVRNKEIDQLRIRFRIAEEEIIHI